MAHPVTLAVEGSTDIPVAQRLLALVGLEVGPIHQKGGKAGLDARLTSYNRAAAFSSWLVLRDLDHDALCAGALVAQLLPRPAKGMCLRIAVRETEAWLLADRDRIAQYLSVSAALIPIDPDALDDAKQTLVNLARRSRYATMRTGIVPSPGTTASVGPGYWGHVAEYATRFWRPTVAARNSPSLARCIKALRRLKG